MQLAVAYNRVSTPRQGKSGLGIEAQDYNLALYCQITETVIVKHFYEVKSGRRKDRPELKKAINYCRKHGTILIIATQNRLARHIGIIHELMISGIKFISADEPLATRYDIYRKAVDDEEESETISKRTKDALAAAKRRGVVLGKNVINMIAGNRKKSHEFTVEMIPIIDQLRREGFTTEPKILREFRRRRIYPLRGRGYRWYPSTVHYLLKRIEKIKSELFRENQRDIVISSPEI